MQIDYKEIKQELNTQSLLNDMLMIYDIKGHIPFFDKDKGEYRVKVGSRNFNAVDYLLKHHNLTFDKVNALLNNSFKTQTRAEHKELIKEISKETLKPKYKIDFKTEIDKFKKDINLAEFVSSYGYSLDKSKSSKNYVALKSEKGDKVIVHKKDDVYLYFNPNDDKDKGSIVEFLVNRGVERKSVYSTIKNRDLTKIEQTELIAPLSNAGSEYNAELLFEKYQSLKPLIDSENTYLQSRGIDKLIASQYSSIKIDERNNIVTPMFITKEKEIFAFAGYNKKLPSPITKSKDGEELKKPIKDLIEGNKSLTILKSDNFTTAQNIVVCESFIDSLSYMQLKNLDPKDTLLVSTNGQNNAKNILMVKELQQKYPNAQTIIAMDNDKAGVKYAETFKYEMPNVKVEMPKTKDYNEDLSAQKQEQEQREQVSKNSYQPQLG